MAILAPRELKIGKIVDKTLAVLEHNSKASLIYVVALTVINGAIAYFSVGLAPLHLLGGELLKFAVGVVFAYLLLDAMVRRTGLRSRGDGDVFLPFIGLSILYTLGVILGFIAIIIPGLFVMARWSLAQPLLVARGAGVMEALGESWDRTRGNEFQIIVAALALLILPIAVAIASSVLFEEGNLVRLVVSQLAGSASGVISLALWVALYGLIVDSGTTASAPKQDPRVDP